MTARFKSDAKEPDVLRIGAYQGPTEPGALEKNAEAALQLLGEAQRKGVDFACLPETYLSGYGAPATLRAAAVAVRGKWFQNWVRRCTFGDMVSIVGFIENRGQHLYNSAAVIQKGKLLGLYTKSIPGSEYEREAVTFAANFPIFKAHGITFGVIICVESSVLEPSRILAEKGARIIFAPHYAFIPMAAVEAHRQRVRNNHIARAVENNCWIVKANTVTEPLRKMGEVEGFGYGDSFILDNLGVPQAEAGIFTTGWIMADAPRQTLSEKQLSRLHGLPPAVCAEMVKLYQQKKT
jgi:predicted amidohydrolase